MKRAEVSIGTSYVENPKVLNGLNKSPLLSEMIHKDYDRESKPPDKAKKDMLYKLRKH